MPVNNFSIGKDVTVNITVGGTPFVFPPDSVMSFKTSPETQTERRKSLNGKVKNFVFPDGWQGSFQVDRTDSTIENFWAKIEEAYYGGKNVGTGTIRETVLNPDGSVSQWLYTDVVFKLSDIGERQADQVIKMTLDFMASRRLAVS